MNISKTRLIFGIALVAVGFWFIGISTFGLIAGPLITQRQFDQMHAAWAEANRINLEYSKLVNQYKNLTKTLIKQRNEAESRCGNQ